MDPCFSERYRLVLQLILDGSVKESTFVQRFCSETRSLFKEADLSLHEDLWKQSGLDDHLSSKSIHLVSILHFLIPVIAPKILKERIAPVLLSGLESGLDRKRSEAVLTLMDYDEVPLSIMETHFHLPHPVRIKYEAYSLLNNPQKLEGSSPSAVRILRLILNQKPPSQIDKLRAIGSQIRLEQSSKECLILKTLFDGSTEEELPRDMCIDSYFDCLKYFSRYTHDTRVSMKKSLLTNFVQLLNKSSNKRVVLRVVDGLVRFGAIIDSLFVHKSLIELLSSYIIVVDDKGPSRDAEASDLDSKLLSCTLEACRDFYARNRSPEARGIFERLLLYSKLEVGHIVSCLQVLNLLASEDMPEMSSDLWFRIATSRHWEVMETFLHFIARHVALNKTKGLPPLKGFLAGVLAHENSFVRTSGLAVLQTIAEKEGIDGLAKAIESPNVETFFSGIFEGEAEAIVRRGAARLLGTLEMSEALKEVSMSVLRKDLDWEVKEILLDVWLRLPKDPLAIEVCGIVRNDPERRLRQKAALCLRDSGLNIVQEDENCFDEYVESTFGLRGLMDDILQIKCEMYTTYDPDCF